MSFSAGWNCCREVNPWVYGTPDDLRAAIDRMVEADNDTPHEALKNMRPNHVYADRKDEVMKRRARIGLVTMARRQAYIMGADAETANQFRRRHFPESPKTHRF